MNPNNSSLHYNTYGHQNYYYSLPPFSYFQNNIPRGCDTWLTRPWSPAGPSPPLPPPQLLVPPPPPPRNDCQIERNSINGPQTNFPSPLTNVLKFNRPVNQPSLTENCQIQVPLQHHSVPQQNIRLPNNSVPSKRVPKKQNSDKTSRVPKPREHSVLQKGKAYLHFILEDLTLKKYRENYKIDERFKKTFLKNMSSATEHSGTGSLFCKSVDEWKTPVDEKKLRDTAKQAVLMVHIFGTKGIETIKTILSKRLDAVSGSWSSEWEKRMTLIYFMYLIIIAEAVNNDLGKSSERPLRKLLENLFSNPQKSRFRELVKKVPVERKQEMYSLRCKLHRYFSKKSLETIDRDHFWRKIARDVNPVRNRNSENPVVATTVHKEACSQKDDLDFLSQTMDWILKTEWLHEFSISECDKRKFTEKYAVQKPSEKNAIYLYDKCVEFHDGYLLSSINSVFPAADRDQMIHLAKEAFYLGKVFGKKKMSSIVEILIMKMGESNLQGEKQSLHERLLGLLLVHVIILAESTQTSYRSKPKEERPFCSGIANDTFVKNFKNLVSSFKEENNKQNLFWMRLVWNSCLPEKCLLKIDANHFWQTISVQISDLPVQYVLKKQTKPNSNNSREEMREHEQEEIEIVAEIDKQELHSENPLVIVDSSEDEESEEVLLSDEPSCSEINDITIAITPPNAANDAMAVDMKEKNVNSQRNNISSDSTIPENTNGVLQHSMQTWWTEQIFMDDEYLIKILQKYNLSEENCIERLNSEELLKIFCDSVSNVFPYADTKKISDVAKEAFYLTTVHSGIAHDIINHLIFQTLDGFDLTGPLEWKLASRVIAFLIMHFIVSIESIETFDPNVSEKPFGKALKELLRSSLSVANLMRDIENKEIKKKIRFLTLTWSMSNYADENSDSKESHNEDLVNSMEVDHINDIIEYSKRICKDSKYNNDESKMSSDDKNSVSNHGFCSVSNMSSDNSKSTKVFPSGKCCIKPEEIRRLKTKMRKRKRSSSSVYSSDSEDAETTINIFEAFQKKSETSKANFIKCNDNKNLHNEAEEVDSDDSMISTLTVCLQKSTVHAKESREKSFKKPKLENATFGVLDENNCAPLLGETKEDAHTNESLQLQFHNVPEIAQQKVEPQKIIKKKRKEIKNGQSSKPANRVKVIKDHFERPEFIDYLLELPFDIDFSNGHAEVKFTHDT